MPSSDLPSSPGAILKGGRRLTTLDEWHSYAPPKKKHRHWKDGRSAKESARAWLDASPALPSEIRDVLHSCNDIGPLQDWCAEPEAKVRIDEFPREQPNIDVLVTGYDDYGPVVVAIEAKADEPFGETVEKTRSGAEKDLKKKPNSKRLARLQRLAELFRLSLDTPDVLKLRYQLMTLTAAVLAKAERRSAQRAIVIVHEFITPLTTAEYRTRNSHDLDRFLATVFGQRNSLRPGTLFGPYKSTRKPMLYFGKARRTVR